MSRDHRNLRVFRDADELVITVYRTTGGMPPEERYGLQAQIRRAAVSAVTNIVEGAARPGARDYRRFLYIAHASARECAYLLDLCARLEMLERHATQAVVVRYGRLQAQLLALVKAIGAKERGCTSHLET